MNEYTWTQRGLASIWVAGRIAGGSGLLFALYIWVMFSWNYSKGERAGWVQKLSKKGYLCKTWEGEMAMVSLPGSVPEKFIFTVWDDRTAEEINRLMGKRVALNYEEHIWLPTIVLRRDRAISSWRQAGRGHPGCSMNHPERTRHGDQESGRPGQPQKPQSSVPLMTDQSRTCSRTTT